jgi:hypothetical protein
MEAAVLLKGLAACIGFCAVTFLLTALAFRRRARMA